jgi:nitroreductase
VIVIADPELKNQILPVANNQLQIVASSHLLVFAAWDKITTERVEDYISLNAQTRKVSLESLDGLKSKLLNISKRSDEENFELAARQAYIAFATGIAAAAEERVDATPMEGFNNVALDELLNLKDKSLRSLTLLPLGYREKEKNWLVNLPKVRREKENLFITEKVLLDKN